MELSLRSPRIASSSICYGPFLSVRYIALIHRIDTSTRYIGSIYPSTTGRDMAKGAGCPAPFGVTRSETDLLEGRPRSSEHEVVTKRDHAVVSDRDRAAIYAETARRCEYEVLAGRDVPQ